MPFGVASNDAEGSIPSVPPVCITRTRGSCFVTDRSCCGWDWEAALLLGVLAFVPDCARSTLPPAPFKGDPFAEGMAAAEPWPTCCVDPFDARTLRLPRIRHTAACGR